MQTWVAYQLDEPVDPAWVTKALHRVERHYHPERTRTSSPDTVRRDSVGASRSGMALWDAAAPDCRWPSWVEHGRVTVATVLLPLGWQRVLRAPSTAPDPVALADAIFADPADALATLSPPFIVARFIAGDVPQLDICNDGLGFATLYHLRFAGGDVWSNRLGALPLFAAVRAVPDERAWVTFAACGWFMGSDVPLDGASLVPPGTVIRLGGERRWRAEVHPTGVVSRWVSRHGARHDDDEVVIDSLGEDLVRLAQLFSDPPVADLTAGLDSRLNAAVAVAQGLDVVFRTANPDWEVRTARHLLELAPRSYRHNTPTPGEVPPGAGGDRSVDASTAQGASLFNRAAVLHHAYDGDWPPADIGPRHDASPGVPRNVRITGGAGELAKGHFGKRHDRLHAAAPDDVARFLHGFFAAQASGVTREGSALVRARVDDTVTLGLEIGVRGDALREFFYLMERVRRWGRANRRVSVANPLLNPVFVRAAFDLTSSQRGRGELHKRIIGALVPAWRDVP